MLGLVNIDQPEIRLVHQGRGLKRLTRILMDELRRGQFSQLLIDQRQELVGGTRVA